MIIKKKLYLIIIKIIVPLSLKKIHLKICITIGEETQINLKSILFLQIIKLMMEESF